MSEETVKKEKNGMSIFAARNGFTVRTRSGVYVCTTIAQLLEQVKSYAAVIQKEASSVAPTDKA